MQEVIGTIEKNAKEQVRIELTEFKGFDLLGVRVYAQTESGYTPTKKGITVNVKILPELLTALNKAQAAAVKAGLLAQEDMTRCDRCDKGGCHSVTPQQ